MALGELRQAIKTQVLRVNDAETLKECTTFCKQPDNSYKANSGCHDDRVLALAIGSYLHKILPYRPDYDEEEERDRRYPERQVFTHGHKTGY